MKQPSNRLSVFVDLEDLGEKWIDITCDSGDGGFCNVGIGRGKTRKAAYKAAAKRLRKLASTADIMADKVED